MKDYIEIFRYVKWNQYLTVNFIKSFHKSQLERVFH